MQDIKEKFTALKKKLTVGFICTLPFIIGFVVLGGGAHPKTGEAYGLPIYVWVSVCFVPIIVYVAFALKYWRCPACKAYLGKNYSPNYCPKCAARLQ